MDKTPAEELRKLAVTVTLEHDRPYDPEFVRATFAMFFTHGDRIEITDVRWL